ncbi:MAG: hypothetical protein WC719_01510 [Patescibacteria group bacterium]|jgi:hypothetical protein
MTQEEIKIIGEKMAAEKASPTEKLNLLREINAIIEGLRDDIADLKASKKISDSL